MADRSEKYSRVFAVKLLHVASLSDIGKAFKPRHKQLDHDHNRAIDVCVPFMYVWLQWTTYSIMQQIMYRKSIAVVADYVTSLKMSRP